MIQRHPRNNVPYQNGAVKNHAPAGLKIQKGKSTTDILKEWFRLFAHKTARAVGSAWSFLLAVLVIIAWAVTGPMFHYSDTWQLVINTATTIVTFLMVFLIQNTQNRDAKAIHLKLDELLRGVEGARNRLINLECLSEEELDRLQKQFERLQRRAAPVPQPQPEQSKTGK